MAVQSLVETIVSVCDGDSPLLAQFFTLLTPSQAEWSRIRQALPPQVGHHCRGLGLIELSTSSARHSHVDPARFSLQWIKAPLLTSRHRGVCEASSEDIWKFRLSSRLPAHLCACALLGRVARLAEPTPPDQREADSPPQLPNLQDTGTLADSCFPVVLLSCVCLPHSHV